MGTQPRIVIHNDRPAVLEEFGASLRMKKTASHEAVDQQLREVEKAETEAQSKHTEEMRRAGLDDTNVVKPIFQKDANGHFFYKIPGEDFQVQGPYETYGLATTAAQEELSGGPRKTAAYPEFDHEISKRAEVGDEFPEIPTGVNKQGPQPPELNTTEESFFGGPQQVVEQYNANKTAAEGDEVSPNKGTTLEGVQKMHISTPESDRKFDGNDGENIQGVHKPIINTKTDSEFGSPKQVG